jgi:hypothetical protein
MGGTAVAVGARVGAPARGKRTTAGERGGDGRPGWTKWGKPVSFQGYSRHRAPRYEGPAFYLDAARNI